MKESLLILSVLINIFVIPIAYSKCKPKPVTIGIIDTGFGYLNNGKDEAKLCQFGHKDFTIQQQFYKDPHIKTPIPVDVVGHGTNIAGIIESYADNTNVNYCMVILKYYMGSGMGSFQNGQNTIRAIEYAANIKLDFLNYSSGGRDPSEAEYAAIERFLDSGGTLVVAAGNDGENLDEDGHDYYPAKYVKKDKRIIVVGMLDKNGVPLKSSNYGTIVSRWEVGVNVWGFGLVQTGTSQATATATGKLVSQRKNRCE